MKRSTKSFSTLVPGLKPPDYVLTAMRRYHPRCKLVWNIDYGRWQVIERTNDGEWDHLMILHGPDGEFVMPTLANTVDHLNRCHIASMSYWEWKRFAEDTENDAAQDRADREKDDLISDIARETANAIYNEMHGKVSVLT